MANMKPEKILLFCAILIADFYVYKQKGFFSFSLMSVYKDITSQISKLAERIVADFTSAGLSLSAAESCSGGMIASALVSIPHASAVFRGSAVCYCDEAKMRILGVPGQILKRNFAESSECAVEMARGALEIFSSDAAVSATGFLDSNVGDKPSELSGRVFLAVAYRPLGENPDFKVEEIALDPLSDRNLNRAKVVLRGLEKLLDIEWQR